MEVRKGGFKICREPLVYSKLVVAGSAKSGQYWLNKIGKLINLLPVNAQSLSPIPGCKGAILLYPYSIISTVVVKLATHFVLF